MYALHCTHITRSFDRSCRVFACNYTLVLCVCVTCVAEREREDYVYIKSQEEKEEEEMLLRDWLLLPLPLNWLVV